jgi:DNA-binding NtrC family response regulator
MPADKQILSVAYIRDLGQSRQALLRAAGYQVKTVDTATEAVRQLKEDKFDLVIVGHAVRGCDDHLVVEAAESAGNVQTLLLYKASPHSSGKQQHFNVDDGPDEFLPVVAQMCKEKPEKA